MFEFHTYFHFYALTHTYYSHTLTTYTYLLLTHTYYLHTLKLTYPLETFVQTVDCP